MQCLAETLLQQVRREQ